MTMHLLKLCVGAESLEDQHNWAQQRLLDMRKSGTKPQLFHTTRMVPKARHDLLDGGSLYWVIKGQIQARQALLDIEPFVDTDGIRRCHLILGNEIVPTQWQPRRAFQGWRYLTPEDAPEDLGAAQTAVPAHLRAELAELGLL